MLGCECLNGIGSHGGGDKALLRMLGFGSREMHSSMGRLLLKSTGNNAGVSWRRSYLRKTNNGNSKAPGENWNGNPKLSLVQLLEETEKSEDDEASLGVRAALSLVKFYKREISPLLPASCRYVPSCSEYSMIAYKKYGVIKGTVLTAWRLCRCNPLDRAEKQKIQIA
ncbi:hypothetical protein H6P81_003023 [Aristolochia fimbriata]|uniref:Membrane protein insertion efficiency factor YidD n=1 Tax=Aristolochia fimbriata TaxID=158543 RepID=A0AAV7FEC1_ARIFI|nr:hypothetical protein H6P81_003023 [Aristolochia fimbriata]